MIGRNRTNNLRDGVSCNWDGEKIHSMSQQTRISPVIFGSLHSSSWCSHDFLNSSEKATKANSSASFLGDSLWWSHKDLDCWNVGSSVFARARGSWPAGQSRRPEAGCFSRPALPARPDFSGEVRPRKEATKIMFSKFILPNSGRKIYNKLFFLQKKIAWSYIANLLVKKVYKNNHQINSRRGKSNMHVLLKDGRFNNKITWSSRIVRAVQTILQQRNAEHAFYERSFSFSNVKGYTCLILHTTTQYLLCSSHLSSFEISLNLCFDLRCTSLILIPSPWSL